MPYCSTCKEEREVQVDGQFAKVLTCNHYYMVTNIPTSQIIKSGATAVEAETIKAKLDKIEVLPQIDTQEVTTRALTGMKKNYDDFFTSENILIESMISEHGKDKAILMLTAIHSHMSHVLFTMSRFRNLYIQHIEELRKEVEDKAVKELISNHDFYYKDLDTKAKPKKVRTPNSQTGDTIVKAKESIGKLTDKDGRPLDMMKVFGGLFGGKSEKQKEKEAEKEDYKKGLENIAASIFGKSNKEDDKAS